MIPPLPPQSIPSEDVEGGFSSPHASVPNKFPTDTSARLSQHQDSSQFNQAPALEDYPFDTSTGLSQHQDSLQFNQAPALEDYPFDIFAGFPRHHVPAQFDQPPALENCPANRATRPQYPSSSRVD
ncbi:hypothetical protein MRS44_003870 [Fusarium solani]|uniref:uncharacterized protein n=1 Tax=Fusarium solani TaxID=169388 RepID=UPI0032C46716|nr:hypothetical protein MRS44_003870 [Fusarium solani]